MNTRLRKLDTVENGVSALILATSGLHRLGWADRITSTLEYPALMHAVGQGALAVETRTGDVATRDVLRLIGHWQTEWRVAAERGLLRVLEGGCSVPVGVETALTEDTEDAKPYYPADTFAPLASDAPILHFSGLLEPNASFPAPGTTPELRTRRARLEMKACVTSPEGKRHVLYEPGPVVVTSWREAERWGEDCARQLRTLGASAILDDIEKQRQAREAETYAQAQAAVANATAQQAAA